MPEPIIEPTTRATRARSDNFCSAEVVMAWSTDSEVDSLSGSTDKPMYHPAFDPV
jgi:hypothetical protein